MIKIILPLFLLTGCVTESCRKHYSFTGVVTDAEENPLADVEVSFVGSDGGIIATTDADGVYMFNTTTRSNYSGRQLQFSKIGYETVATLSYSGDEAGKDRCGEISLIRDVSLEISSE